jgi:hypothetical protein
MDIASLLLIVFVSGVVCFVAGTAIAGLIIGRSIVLTNDIFERLSFILGITYKIIGVVVVIYIATPDSIIREMFVNAMSIVMYTLYRLDIDTLKSIDNRNI